MKKLQETLEAEVQNSESLKFTKSVKSDRDLLLEVLDNEQKKVKNISFKTLLLVYFLIFLVLLISLPKIYISNQIYYTSKKIDTMRQKYSALKEENSYLNRKLKSVKYKIEVLDEVED